MFNGTTNVRKKYNAHRAWDQKFTDVNGYSLHGFYSLIHRLTVQPLFLLPLNTVNLKLSKLFIPLDTLRVSSSYFSLPHPPLCN